MLKLMREGWSYTHPPLPIARYSFIQLSELERCREKKLNQGFKIVALPTPEPLHSSFSTLI